MTGPWRSSPWSRTSRTACGGGEAYSLTLANGGLTIQYNPQFDLPAEVKDAAEATIQGIVNGDIQIPVGGE